MWTDLIVKIIVISSGFANLFLAVYVYTRNPKARLNKNFLYLGFAIFLWCVINFISLLAKDLFWIRVTYSMGNVVALAGVFFSYALSDKKINKWLGIFLSATCAIFFVICIYTPLLFKSLVSFTDLGFVTTAGQLFYVWGSYLFLLVFIVLYVPLSIIKKVDDQKRNQILYYLAGVAIFAIWSVIVDVVLPSLGISKLVNLDAPATVFMVGFTSYAIIKYHLMNIRSLIFQAFIYSSVIIGIIIILLFLMFAGSYLFAHAMIWPVYVIAVLTSIVLFFIGRLFFMEKRDLEKAEINLIGMLKRSEKNRIEAETERDKTLTIINSFSDGLIIVDEKNNIFSINPEAEKILELKSISLFKKPLQNLVNFPKAVPIASVLNTGLINLFKKEIDLAKDFIIELSVIPLNLGEKDIGHLIVLHDVSRDRMVEKMKTEFVSLVAHQLRTPLTAVNWSMEMLKKGDFGKLSEKQNEVIENTLHNNERLISLVNNILNLTRIEEGRYLYETAMVGMKEIVNFVIDSYKSEIKERKIDLEFKEPDNLSQTMVDVEKIKLAVQNLIDNAIQYSLVGGRVIITLENDEKNIIFKIQDFGAGIPKSQQGKIFGKFFRADNAIKIDPNGTGLGLFLTKNIINAHGGKIWFESKEGAGTTVYFSLPISNKKI